MLYSSKYKSSYPYRIFNFNSKLYNPYLQLSSQTTANTTHARCTIKKASNYKSSEVTGGKNAPPAHSLQIRDSPRAQGGDTRNENETCRTTAAEALSAQNGAIFHNITREIMAMLVSDDRESIVAPSARPYT